MLLNLMQFVIFFFLGYAIYLFLYIHTHSTNHVGLLEYLVAKKIFKSFKKFSLISTYEDSSKVIIDDFKEMFPFYNYDDIENAFAKSSIASRNIMKSIVDLDRNVVSLNMLITVTKILHREKKCLKFYRYLFEELVVTESITETYQSSNKNDKRVYSIPYIIRSRLDDITKTIYKRVEHL